jgi:ADP-heptose:LPS heptosyltransferase
VLYIILTYLFSPIIYLLLSFKKKAVKRILIIQTAKIGDLICSTPVFRAIRKRYPDAHLTAMVSPVTKELLENNPNVDKIIPIKNTDLKGFSGKWRLSGLIRKGRYDIAIALNPNVPFAIALFWGLVPVRLSIMPNFSGITFRLASLFYTYLEKHISGRLITETYIQMLKNIGIESTNISKEVYKSDTADTKAEQILGKIDKPLIGIAVSSGNKLKELGAEKIAKITDLLLGNFDACIVLIGSIYDTDVANRVLDLAIKKYKVINTTGRLDLNELPALIERLSLFIGVDTGITYMADALSVPIIHLAGPIDTSEQRPIGEKVFIIQNKLSCLPCTYVFKAAYTCKMNTRECIKMIKIEEIVDAAKKFIHK